MREKWKLENKTTSEKKKTNGITSFGYNESNHLFGSIQHRRDNESRWKLFDLERVMAKCLGNLTIKSATLLTCSRSQVDLRKNKMYKKNLEGGVGKLLRNVE